MHFCTSHDSHLTALDAFKLGWVMVGKGLIGGITRKLWVVRSTILRNYFQVKENMVVIQKTCHRKDQLAKKGQRL